MHPAQWLLAFILAIAFHLALLTLIAATWASTASSPFAPQGVTISLSNLGGPSEVSSKVVAMTPDQPTDTLQPTSASATSPAIPQAAAPVPTTSPSTGISSPQPTSANSVNVPISQTHSEIAASQPKQAEPSSDHEQASPQPSTSSGGTIAKEPEQTADAAVQNPLKTVNAQRVRVGQVRPGAGTINAGDYTSLVHDALAAHRTYPPEARRRNLEGRVLVRLIIDQSGNLVRVSVARSSGYDILDQAAIKAVKAAAPFSPIPPSTGRTRIAITTPYTYGLRDAD